MKLPERCCGKCEYFSHSEELPKDEGICSGRPPQIIVVDGEVFNARPTVDGDDRPCADYRPQGLN